MEWTAELERKTDSEARALARQKTSGMKFSEKFLKGTIGAKIFAILGLLSIVGFVRCLFEFNVITELWWIFLFLFFTSLFKRNEEDRLTRIFYLQKKSDLMSGKL